MICCKFGEIWLLCEFEVSDVDLRLFLCLTSWNSGSEWWDEAIRAVPKMKMKGREGMNIMKIADYNFFYSMYVV
jgi:hypothetical protein